MGCWAPVRKGEGAYIGCYNISLLLWIISFPGVLSTATCVLLSLLVVFQSFSLVRLGLFLQRRQVCLVKQDT